MCINLLDLSSPLNAELSVWPVGVVRGPWIVVGYIHAMLFTLFGGTFLVSEAV